MLELGSESVHCGVRQSECYVLISSVPKTQELSKHGEALNTPPPIHLNTSARHITCLLTRQEAGHIRYICHLREAAHRNRREQWCAVLRRVRLAHDEAEHGRFAERWGDSVHADVVLGIFDGEAFRGGLYGAFGGAVPVGGGAG